MKTFIKILYISMLLGIVLIVSGVALGANIDSVKEVLTDQANYTPYETTIDTSYDAIKIITEHKNVDIKVSSEVEYPKLNYYLKDTEFFEQGVDEAGLLTVRSMLKPHINNWFSFGFSPSKYHTLYVVLPITYQGKLDIHTTAGNIRVDGTFDETKLSSQFGNVDVTGEFMSLSVDQKAGNTDLYDIHINGALAVEGQSGNIKVSNATVLSNINLEVSAGNIAVDYVEAASYELKTAAGNISFKTNKKAIDFEMILKTNAGNNRVNGTKVSRDYQSGTGILLDLKTHAGNISVNTK